MTVVSIAKRRRRSRPKKPPQYCTIEGCDRLVHARGWCGKHYNCWLATGNPIAKYIKNDDPKRFWSQVFKTDTCWFWIGGTTNMWGYGQILIKKKLILVHRYSFFLHHGYWPTPCCLHSCDNPLCVNPAHLREGTNQDNSNDAVARNRRPKGERHACSRLTENQIREIRKCVANGASQASMARRFDVHPGTVFAIVHRTSWYHID